jgi:hypothetical protein
VRFIFCAMHFTPRDLGTLPPVYASACSLHFTPGIRSFSSHLTPRKLRAFIDLPPGLGCGFSVGPFHLSRYPVLGSTYTVLDLSFRMSQLI